MEATTEIKSKKIKDVVISNDPTLKTGNEKFDNWFSFKGGIVLRSAIFVSGTSGAGKSTLMLSIMNWLSNTTTCMYEREVESKDIKAQVLNAAPKHDNAYICDKKSHPHFIDFMKELDIVKPKVVIVDSLQAIAMEDFTELSEEDACNHIIKKLRDWTSDNDSVLFIIGHNTKQDDVFRGNNTILQLMDVHVEMVYDKKNDIRTISFGKKNRKGPMGTLYYIFGKDGIEFFTEEEFESRTQERNFKESFVKFVTNYVSTANIKTKAGSNLVNEYNKAIKVINKSDDSDEICSNILSLMMELSDKNE